MYGLSTNKERRNKGKEKKSERSRRVHASPIAFSYWNHAIMIYINLIIYICFRLKFIHSKVYQTLR